MLKQYLERVRKENLPYEKMQVTKRQTRYTYTDGPMRFLAQQIVKGMEDAGYPAAIIGFYVSPNDQNRKYVLGQDPHRAFQSPFQYLEAAVINHPTITYENTSIQYWETFEAVVQIVADKFGVRVNHGDHLEGMGYVELSDWRDFRDVIRKNNDGVDRSPFPLELFQRFYEVLPGPAKQYARTPKFTIWLCQQIGQAEMKHYDFGHDY